MPESKHVSTRTASGPPADPPTSFKHGRRQHHFSKTGFRGHEKIRRKPTKLKSIEKIHDRTRYHVDGAD